MSEGVSEALQAELKNKRICRFCLTQNEPLSNIYSRENRLKNSAPLPLQVMSCVSIEVFTNDGMPNTICDLCRILMEHCYKFKQMCKKADTALRQYPLTNKWPKQLEIPKIPSEVISETDKSPPTSSNSSPVVDKKPVAHQQEKYQTSPVQPPSKPVKKTATPGRPKLLNKNFNRILNKNAQDAPEPILSLPVVKMYESGNVEIVTEIIDQSDVKKYEEPDPIKNAAPVETNVFPCPNCERSFPLRQLLDIHMVNHTRERSFQCNVCDRRFFSKYDLGKHSLIHTGEKPYQCVVCDKAFTRSTLLYRHEKIHTDQPKFLCVYCEKPFLSKDELAKHTERHKKNRPFSCKICGKSFAFKQGLERHEIVHAKDQPYPCQYCDKSFPTPSKLSRHLTAHAGDRPFPCRLCPNSYLLSHHLTRHMRSHTQGSGSYKCYDCEKTFKTRDDLIYHSAVHATQTLVCPLCKEQFESLDRVTEHIKLHAEGEQYACEFCDLIFMTAEKLQSHSDVEHAEDLAAYEQDTKNKIANVKKEMHNKYDEESQDGQQEEGEVIEEFIIEEYHQDDEEHNLGEAESTLIKEENIIIAKDISLTPVQKAAPKILNSQQKIKIVSPKGNTIQEIHLTEDESRGEEEYVEDMEIEALERDDDTNEFVKEAEKIEEPPTKTIKLDQRSSPRIADQRVAKEAPKTSPITRKTPRPIVKTESQRTKPSISSVLQQIPKSVTVIKKEKGTENATTTSQPPQKEVRILNNDRPTKKSTQQASHKTPVKVSPEKTKHDPKPTKQSTEISKKALNNSSDSISSQSSTTTDKKTSSAAKSSVPQAIPGSKKLVEMMIGDKKVKVQKIMMTKAAVAAMAKEGKIEMKGGTMILKQDNKTLSGKVVKKTAGADTKK